MADQISKHYKEILSGPFSKGSTCIIIGDVGEDKQKFSILINFVLRNCEPLSSRAAWVIEGIDKNIPSLIEPYIPKLIKMLPSFSHPGTQRNLLKILTRKNIPEPLIGKLTNICIEWLQKRDVPVSIQVYSMKILENFSEPYPELMFEVHEILKSRIQYSLPGFKSKAKKILQKKLKY